MVGVLSKLLAPAKIVSQLDVIIGSCALRLYSALLISDGDACSPCWSSQNTQLSSLVGLQLLNVATVPSSALVTGFPLPGGIVSGCRDPGGL